MSTLYTSLSASDAQELRGGESSPSNGTGSNAGGTRTPASEAGFSEEKGSIPTYTGKGNHFGWSDGDVVEGLG